MTGAENMTGKRKPIFVTGATGYVGSRLVPRLVEAGYGVRCLVRDRRKLAGRSWSDKPQVEIVEGDVDDPVRLAEMMSGCSAGYYLIHSMVAAGPRHRTQHRRLALNYARAAAQAGLQRIIYLGGLGEMGDRVSRWLASRRAVEDALSSGSCPVTTLRAAMIIGSGSASFEILRNLVGRFPFVITPWWVTYECQPIAIRNVLHYLVACLATPETVGRTLEIGGADVVTYGDLMRLTAEAMGRSRYIIIPVPAVVPGLDPLWMHVTTPVGRHIARPLVEGLRHRVVCRNDHVSRLMPQDLLTARQAIIAAMGSVQVGKIESAWSDGGLVPQDPDWSRGTVYEDRRTIMVDAPPQRVFEAVCRIGGRQGYYSANWLWQVRGWMDRIVGGPGLHRGRRDPDRITVGSVIDFWRVSRLEPEKRLHLRAEMKVPGEALLEFEVSAGDGSSDTSRLTQTARFKPAGLPGIVYWLGIIPLHNIVFGGMIDGIRRAAETTAQLAARS
ncbi:MAG: SDR family oxidoreductase [Phycisphaerales bacterium]|nr:MAG: SDR family oxidoreductase [Phycisphaerales bacterium]